VGRARAPHQEPFLECFFETYLFWFRRHRRRPFYRRIRLEHFPFLGQFLKLQ